MKELRRHKSTPRAYMNVKPDVGQPFLPIKNHSLLPSL